jgi:hypothetical protein
MKSIHLFTGGLLAAFTFIMLPYAHGFLIDFNSVPDGTPVSAGDPYGGILQLSTTRGVNYSGSQLNDETEATIQDGILSTLQENQDPILIDFFYSDIIGTFTVPVSNVSLDLFTYRTAGYSYTAMDANNNVWVSEIGATQANPLAGFELETFSLTVPEGYWLTEFRIGNRDQMSRWAAIWLDNIQGELGPQPQQRVPEGGGTGGFLALILCAVAIISRTYMLRKIHD